jgi:hypothetical protein
MKSIIRNAFLGLCATALFLALSNSAQAQISAGSGDIAGNVGYSNLVGVDGNKHINFGGTLGYNFIPSSTLVFEYSYLPMGSVSGVNGNYQLLGVADRWNFGGNEKVVPYVVVGFGYARCGASADLGGGATVSAAANGYYAGGGAGASFFLGKNWGIRPEFRYDEQAYSLDGTTTTQNAFRVSGSLFFQFGGQSTSKKKASSGN